MPNEHENFKFTAYHALEPASHVAYFDLESILVENNSKTKSGTLLNTHKAIAYCYIIVDKNRKIKYIRHETANDKDMLVRMINQLFKDHEEILESERRSWCLKPYLTKDDEKNSIIIQNVNIVVVNTQITILKLDITTIQFIRNFQKTRRRL